MQSCGAKTRTGSTCKSKAMANGRCRMHGGQATGAALTAGGRHSKHLPQRLAARYEEALRDEELIVVRGEIALMDARIGELCQRLDTSESSAAWTQARRLFGQMQVGLAPERAAAQMALGELLDKGLADVLAWAEIASIVEQRRKLCETEQKRLAQLDQFITAKQANVLGAAILKLITDHVADPDARTKIGHGIISLFGSGGESGASGTTPIIN